MALLRLGADRGASPQIMAGELLLRAPTLPDFQSWAELRQQSRDFLAPWEPTWRTDELTRASFRRRIIYYNAEWRNGSSHPLFIFRIPAKKHAAPVLLGGLTLGNVRRGAAQCCTLGYWMGAPYAGQGYMTKAVHAIIPFAFADLHLHRIEAACVPGNTASRRLLEKTGFTYEGLARRYLKINGAWEDHLLYALLEDDIRSKIPDE